MRPWDYLGALLACREAGATVCDAHDEELVTTEPGAHRRIVAAGTSELAEILKRAGRVTDLDLDTLLAAARTAARAGGEVVAAHFGAPDEVREKAPGDWVSAADLASEAAVREILVRTTGIPVYGEEEGGERAATEWLVDPLDGTANFVHGLDAVGVSIGLVERRHARRRCRARAAAAGVRRHGSDAPTGRPPAVERSATAGASR